MIIQVDSDGFSTTIMDGVVDYRRVSAIAVPKSDMYVVTKQGHKSIRQATIVWKFKVQWKDYTKKLTPLNILKESNKVELAEFEVERDIAY